MLSCQKRKDIQFKIILNRENRTSSHWRGKKTHICAWNLIKIQINMCLNFYTFSLSIYESVIKLIIV